MGKPKQPEKRAPAKPGTVELPPMSEEDFDAAMRRALAIPKDALPPKAKPTNKTKPGTKKK